MGHEGTAILGYAPPARNERRWMGVVGLGVLTTLLAVGGSVWLDYVAEVSFIRVYAIGLIPAGAMIVGAMAATGYAIGAWWVGLRIRRGLLLGVLAVTLLGYVGMHWGDYLLSRKPTNPATRQPVTFLEFYDLKTRSMRFEATYSRPKNFLEPEEDRSFGVLGYGVRLLELLGFSAGAFLVPWLMRKKRYCDLCERYYRTHQLAVIPASRPVKKTLGVFTPETIQFKEEDQAVARHCEEVVRQLDEQLHVLDLKAFRESLTKLKEGSTAANKLPRRVAVLLSRCEQCGQAVYHPTVLTGIDPRSSQKHVLAEVRLTADVADQILPRGKQGRLMEDSAVHLKS